MCIRIDMYYLVDVISHRSPFTPKFTTIIAHYVTERILCSHLDVRWCHSPHNFIPVGGSGFSEGHLDRQILH